MAGRIEHGPFTIRRHKDHGRGTSTVRLVECPACGLVFDDDVGQSRIAHIAGHAPEDFGLSPLGTEDQDMMATETPTSRDAGGRR